MAHLRALVNWFHGNYCARKCHHDEERQERHYPLLQELARALDGTEMTHAAFLGMLRGDRTICDLSDEEWRERKFSWKQKGCGICAGLFLHRKVSPIE